MTAPDDGGLLAGLRVVEIGHFVAAPFCTRLLADQGADVIKIEKPGVGDPVRQWGEQINGQGIWWSVHGRNKRCVTLDIRHPRGQEISLEIIAAADAVVENFRPGQLEGIGLTEERMRAVNPDLVIARISGYGQQGPHRHRAAFGVIGEAVGGLRHLTNHDPETSDLPPVRTGVSLGDSVSGLYAAMGVLAALWCRREKHRSGGVTVDVALADSVLSLLEGVLPEYGSLGLVRQPSGGHLPTNSPSNAYPTQDGQWILIAANSDPLFAKLAATMRRADLLSDARYSDNQNRCANNGALDDEIGAWTIRHRVAELEELLTKADVPATRVYTVADCADDPQYRHRGMVREIQDPAIGRTLHPGIVPHVPEAPGQIRWPGPAVGAHTEEVLNGLLNFSRQDIDLLRKAGVC